MNEIDKIVAQIEKLQAAQLAITNADPSDIASFREIEDMIGYLHTQLRTTAVLPQIPELTKAEVDALEDAEAALETAVNQSAGVEQILAAATALAKS
jgi:hypothetical protein